MANGSITGTTTAEYLPGDEATYAGSMGGATDEYQSYTSEIYWVPQSVTAFSDKWVAAAKTEPVAVFNQTDAKSYIYLNKDAEFISDYILYHERGHNLGFFHSDGGIMSYDAPDMSKQTVDDITKTIAQQSDGATYISWLDDDLHQFYTKWRDGKISDETLEYVLSQYITDGAEDIYSSGTILNQLQHVPENVQLNRGGLYRNGNDGWMVI